MGIVNTVTGPVDASKLGRTLMHEHFLFGFCGYQGDTTIGCFKEEEYMETCMKVVEDAREYGIETIVDATTNECGRNPLFLKKLSEKTGMNIICSTGYYLQPESAYAYWMFRKGFADIESEICEMMVAELTVGIGDTGVKAGCIKLASSYNEITEMEQVFFRAAARAQKETGCVIITHTQQGTMGPEQAKILIENGADPKKIVIGHMCGSTDIAYHEKVLSYGVYDNFDRFGFEGELFHTPTDEERMDLIKALYDKGYGDRIVVGHDSVNVDLGRPVVMTPFMQEAMKWSNVTNMGKRIIPGLKARGLSDEAVDNFLAANPERIFG